MKKKMLNNLWSSKCCHIISYAAASLDDGMILLNKWEQVEEMPSNLQTQGQAADCAFVTKYGLIPSTGYVTSTYI